ncbi:MAG: hypothetical protein JNK19_14235 [Tabrizicola sp.]|nr:hypothetical protein [Tabrizicola sp.]
MASQPRPYSTRVIQSGHSLSDPIPGPLTAMVQAVGGFEAKRGKIDIDAVPGSPMERRWTDRSAYPPDAFVVMPEYDLLVITERAPLSRTLDAHDSRGYALKWFNRAFELGNDGKGADTILYATWAETDSGPDATFNDRDAKLTFRERMVPEMRDWQTIADYVNANRPAGSNPMSVIPGPLIMAAVYDSIEAGTAPGLGSITDLFTDNIHINDLGAYLISLAHFAVIYRRDPRIVPSKMGLQPVPPLEMADWMKELVASVLKDYPDAGLQGVF